MQSALTLTDQERLCFMQALNAVVRRDGSPGEVWLALLRRFENLLSVAATDYQFQAGAPLIAEKLNQIKNRRVRLYFLRIIHDAYRREMDGRPWPKFSEDRFLPLYNALVAAVRPD
jgi:hypothetical protein